MDEVFDIVLSDALAALGAISGAVLLVEQAQLHVVARRGRDAASVWQGGDLSGHRPSPDALRRDTPLFFRESGDLAAAYPDLEGRTSGVAAVASAVLPMVEEGRPLGVIVLNFKEPHNFTPDEQHFLRTLASHCALALDRAQLASDLKGQVRDRTAELEAFVRFTEAANRETDMLALARRAVDILSVFFPGCTTCYYVLEDHLWRLKVYTSDLEDQPELLAAVKAGVPLDTPVFNQPRRMGEPVFTDGWDPQKERFALTEVYQSVAIYPLPIVGIPQAMFAVGIKATPRWSGHDRAVFRSVGRSLGLALERTEQARQLTAQRDLLQVSNEELEAFTYSVSHDLRTPVRHIKGFSELLRKRVGPQLDLQATRYLTVIDEAAGRMDVLIDAMLDLAHTARLPLRLGPVDLDALVLSVRQELEVDEQGRAVRWEVTPLPMITGDHDTLRQVICNLLTNALKYTRPQETAVIEVWAEERAAEWAVFVRDNGVGFDPRYHDRLFGVFQRLHLEREFEGTGVGLANVRRIIVRHGGAVSAQGTLGEGATFSFTLPR